MSKGAQTRATILDRALALASELGLGSLSIGTLAKEVEMSKSGLFAHFKSKEQLQIDVLAAARDRFIAEVISPALSAPRGIPRIRALFDRWLDWENSPNMPGGCIFQTATVELDDRPGPVRDYLVSTQKDWLETLAGAARIAMREGHFRADLDPAQWAFESFSIALGYRFAARLLRDPAARERAQVAMDALIVRSST
jgi:AcrR family transcriptional regulator